jgi:MFS family permease
MQNMTDKQKWLSRKFLIYKLLTNLWFLGAIWLYFYRIYITDREIGVLDGVAFAIGLLAEVPSGVLADKFGRDKMVRLGQFLAGTGIIIQAFGNGLGQFMFGQATMMIGVSFVSGADEALFFDQLKFKQNSSEWRKLITRGSQIALIGSMSATIIGGWIYNLDPKIPWIITGLSLISSVILIWPIKDTRLTKNKQKAFVELGEHLKSIKAGFAEFLTSKLSLYIPIIITVQGLFYAAGWGILRLVLMDRFHFTPFVGSIVIASSSLITVGVLGYMHKHADRLSEKRVLTLISGLAAASLLLSSLDIGIWGYFVILTLYAGEHVLVPFMSEVLNYRTDESQRATVLSVGSFLRTLPYVALAPIIGSLSSQNKLEYFLLTWFAFIALAVLAYLSLKKKDIRISMAEEKVSEDERIPEIATERQTQT